MKSIFKKSILWVSTLIVSTGVAFASFFDYGALNKNNESNQNQNDNNNGTIVKPLTPQQKLLNSIVSLSEASLDGNIEVSTDSLNVDIGVNGSLALDTQAIENTKFEGDVNVALNDFNVSGSLAYNNGKIFLDYENAKLFLETTSLLEFVKMIPNYGVEISLPEEITSLDINELMNDINSMEPEKVNGGYLFKLALNENIELMFKSDEEYNFTGIKSNKFYFGSTYIYLDFDVDQTLDEALTFTEPDISEYQNFEPTFDLVNVLYNTFNADAHTLNLAVDISYLDNPYLALNTDLSFDKTLENLSLVGEVNEISHERKHTFTLGMKEENLIVDYNSLKLRIQNQSIGSLISYVLTKVGDAYLDDVLTSLGDVLGNNDVSSLISDLSNINNLVEDIEVSDNEVAVILNIDFLNLEAKEIKLSFGFDKTTFKGITISGLNINGYQANITLSTKAYTPVNFNLDDYVAIDPALSIVDSIEALSKENRFRFELSGSVKDTNETTSDILIDAGLQFDLANKYGYGELDLVDANKYNHDIKVDMRNMDEILFTYNTKTKGKFSSNFFSDVFDMVNEILNKKDDHFYELFGDLLNSMSSLPLMDAINKKDYGKLFEIGLIDSLAVTENQVKLGIKGGLLGIDSTLNLELNFDSTAEDQTQIIKSLKVNDFTYLDNVYNFEIRLDKFDDSLEATRLDPFDTYIDFDSLAVLLRLGINTSIYNHYHFNGEAVVKLGILGLNIKALNVPLDVKILNEKGNVSVAIELNDIPRIALVNNGDLGQRNIENRKAKIYYKDGYFYIYRSEDFSTSPIFGKDKTYETYAKVESAYFLDNIVYYLCDMILGINDNIMDMILGNESSDTPTTDSTIHYENLLTDFSYNDQVERPYFAFGVNLYELTKMDMFDDLKLNVYVDKESKTLSGIGVNLNINVLATIGLNANLDLVDLGSEFTLDDMNAYMLSHQEDEINKTYEVEKDR